MTAKSEIMRAFQEAYRFFYLRNLKRHRYLSRENLREIQLRKFKKLLIHAYNNVPFYYEKYKKAEINPHCIRTFEDILRIPITTKEEMKGDFPDKMLATRIKLEDCTINNTSGSTGKPFHFAMDWKARAVRDAVHEYVRTIAGCSKNDKLIHLITQEKFYRGLFYGKKNRYKLLWKSDLNFKLGVFEKIRPDFIASSVSIILELALKLEKIEYKFKKPLKGILLTSEVLTPSVKNKIEKVFKTKIFSYYGLGEMADIAGECSAHNGMHEIMEHAYIEILKENHPANETGLGELIITDLDNYAMPFIRYQTGDIGKTSCKFCTCGMKSLIIDSIDGRKQEFFMTEDDKIMHHFIFVGDICPFKQEPLVSLIDQYQIRQSKNKGITIKLATNKKIDQEIKNNLIDYTKKYLGNLKVKIEIVRKIPLEKSGKTKVIISEIAKDKMRKILNE